jgi:hypothetical protein
MTVDFSWNGLTLALLIGAGVGIGVGVIRVLLARRQK